MGRRFIFEHIIFLKHSLLIRKVQVSSMIELKITVDNINYSELINAIIPHIVSNKLAQRTLTAAINAKFNSMSETEKNHAAASFLNT
jgi:hypothetical protein